MFNARIIADSKNLTGQRLTTFIITIPRIVLAEFNTHRIFSRNSASSRAIPFKKMLESVKTNPFIPLAWQKDHSGMQGTEYFSEQQIPMCVAAWLEARDAAVVEARKLNDLGLHKQIVNRVLEPFNHITVVLSATEYGNFFSLRAHKDAQPEFQVLAYKMLELYNSNKPDELIEGQWHIPFNDQMPDIEESVKLKIATARCARVSYLTFDGEINVDKDILG